MKVKTHDELGTAVIYRCNGMIPDGFSERMFKIGLYLVDHTWHVLTHPHYAQKSMEYVCKKLDKLHGIKHFSGYQSMMLGFVVHYLCDFCCMMHRSGGIGNAVDHVRYERELQHYLLENIGDVYKEFVDYQSQDCRQSFPFKKEDIEQRLEIYHRGKHCYLWDINNSIELSLMACRSVFQTVQLNSFNHCDGYDDDDLEAERLLGWRSCP